MMDDVMRAAFSDELEKIAGMKAQIGNALRVGWHGTAANPQRWLGEGLKLKPGMGRAGKAWEYATSLGGATKYMPVGGKAMTVAGVASMAPLMLGGKDSTGHGKSRGERTTGFVGNTLGGIGATGAALAHGIKSPWALMGAGLVGGVAGERVATTPWALKRRAFNRYPVQREPVQMDTSNSAPGGAHSPDAVVGQAQAM